MFVAHEKPQRHVGDKVLKTRLCGKERDKQCNEGINHDNVSGQQDYVRAFALLKFLKSYILYEFFQFFGLLCVVSSLGVSIGDMKLFQAGVVALLVFC